MADTEIVENADVGGGAPPPAPPINETPVDGPGSGRSELRKQLEKNAEAVRKGGEQRRPPAQRSRARQELEQLEADPAEAEPQPAEGGEPQPQSDLKPPEGWAKEAKAEWANLSPAIQTAVAKREADMAKGVEDLKKKQAEIDQALAPRLDTIRRHGHTPAQAVNQLFAWFEALSANPHQAFPALANSFKFDLRSIPGLVPQGMSQQQQQLPQQQQQQPGPQGQQQQQQPPVGDLPPALQQYFQSLEKRVQDLYMGLDQKFGQQLGQLNNSFEQQSQAKTEEILANWAKDKPHYEGVRKMMAYLIGSGAIPPLPNGTADLDKAYDAALFAVPEVRQQVLAEQQKAAEDARKVKAEAEKKLQAEQAAKARKAAGSISPSAPGNPTLPQDKRKKGKSVRESIMEAREELTE